MSSPERPQVLIWPKDSPGSGPLRYDFDSTLAETSRDEGATVVPEHLAKLAPRMLEALKKVEWAVFNDADYGLTKFCQECRRGPDLGHSEECSIGALLTAARGGDSDE